MTSDKKLLTDFAIDKALLDAVKKMQLTEATPVQAAAIPAILKGGDLQITAHTGTGKTLAYLLPTLHHLLTTEPADNPYRLARPRAMILLPTRELARQIESECQKLIGATRLSVCLVTGGEEFPSQIKAQKSNPEIIIATPGRLLKHLESGITDPGWLEILVLDEADRILDMGFSDDLLAIGGYCNKERQTLLFSATLYQKGLGGIRKQLLNTPENIVVETVRDRQEGIEHQVLLTDSPTHKKEQLLWLIQNRDFKKALVFANTRDHAGELHSMFQSAGVRSALLHGEIPHETRKRVLELFNDGTVSVLISTDVASRGLDIPGIDLVINYEMPRTGDDYAHRAGRTGRAGEEGITLSFVSARDWNLMSSIKRYLNLQFVRDEIPDLPAKFSGPKKHKKSGKAIGSKKKRKKAVDQPKVRVKQRKRDQKNIGKRRKPKAVQEAVQAPDKQKAT